MRGESLSGPPPRRIGIRDVAQRAGVAISTVSKVFSGRGEVTPVLRTRVLAAAAELGYQPNFIAQSLRRGSTDLIGFATSDLSDPFSAEIVAGAESVLRPTGCALLVMSSSHDPERRGRQHPLSRQPTRRCDPGLCRRATTIPNCSPRSPSSTGRSSCWRANCTAMYRSMPSAPIIATACARRSSIWSALGHRRIAALTGPGIRRSGRERLAGFLAGMQAGSRRRAS